MKYVIATLILLSAVCVHAQTVYQGAKIDYQILKSCRDDTVIGPVEERICANKDLRSIRVDELYDLRQAYSMVVTSYDQQVFHTFEKGVVQWENSCPNDACLAATFKRVSAVAQDIANGSLTMENVPDDPRVALYTKGGGPSQPAWQDPDAGSSVNNATQPAELSRKQKSEIDSDTLAVVHGLSQFGYVVAVGFSNLVSYIDHQLNN